MLRFFSASLVAKSLARLAAIAAVSVIFAAKAMETQAGMAQAPAAAERVAGLD